MKKLILLLPLITITATAQPGAAPDPNNPLSAWLRGAYMGNRNNIVRTAEKMPEENYGMRPGAQPEVRTFGQQVTHVAFYNFLWCSQAKGEKNPHPGNLDAITSKEEIMKVLNEAFTYCDTAYTALTDESGKQMVDITQENGRQTRN